MTPSPAHVLSEAAGPRRPALGFCVCPWCGTGELYWSVNRQELWSVNCTQSFCQHLRNKPLGLLPDLSQSWIQLSAPPDA